MTVGLRVSSIPGTTRAERVPSRFATPAARFRCAVAAGFFLTAVGALSLANGGAGHADDFFGAFGGLFGQSVFPQYAQPVTSLRYAARPHGRSAHRRAGAALPVRTVSTHRAETRPTRLGRLSMCVRTCDGFAFPVGAYHGAADRDVHEATCQSQCPGARTALYVLPNGSDKIGEAVDVHTGRTYSQMPAAFGYTRVLHDACTCHPRDGNRIASLLRDPTLRRGDAVMTPAGFRVFHGGEHFPYRQADFVSLAHSRDVQDRQRATFRAIERSSVAAAPFAAPKPASASLPVQPERQASLER